MTQKFTVLSYNRWWEPSKGEESALELSKKLAIVLSIHCDPTNTACLLDLCVRYVDEDSPGKNECHLFAKLELDKPYAFPRNGYMITQLAMNNLDNFEKIGGKSSQSLLNNLVLHAAEMIEGVKEAKQ
jgi:hypothetical protein